MDVSINLYRNCFYVWNRFCLLIIDLEKKFIINIVVGFSEGMWVVFIMIGLLNINDLRFFVDVVWG